MRNIELLADRWEMEVKPAIIHRLMSINPRIVSILQKEDIKPALIESTYLYGKVGTGKTYTAFLKLLQWSKYNKINRTFGKSFKFVNATELLDEIKKSYEERESISSSKLIAMYKNVDLLIIDDFGTQSKTDWAYQIFYLIVSHRYDHLLTTIYTSNLSLTQLAKTLTDDRLTSRIQHQCKGRIFNLKGKSFRV
jgi:DNA replication protein DnaC